MNSTIRISYEYVTNVDLFIRFVCFNIQHLDFKEFVLITCNSLKFFILYFLPHVGKNVGKIQIKLYSSLLIFKSDI